MTARRLAPPRKSGALVRRLDVQEREEEEVEREKYQRDEEDEGEASFRTLRISSSRFETLKILKTGLSTGDSLCSSITAREF